MTLLALNIPGEWAPGRGAGAQAQGAGEGVTFVNREQAMCTWEFGEGDGFRVLLGRNCFKDL